MLRNAGRKISKSLFLVIKWLCYCKSRKLCTLKTAQFITHSGLRSGESCFRHHWLPSHGMSSVWSSRVWSACWLQSQHKRRHCQHGHKLAGLHTRLRLDSFWELHVETLYCRKVFTGYVLRSVTKGGGFQSQLERFCLSQWHLDLMKFSGISDGSTCYQQEKNIDKSLIHGTCILGSPVGFKANS